MTNVDEIRKNAPEGTTHYGYDGEDIIYLNYIPVLGYWEGTYYLSDYEVYLFKIKPIPRVI